MNGKIAIVLLSGLLWACAPVQPPAPSAPPPAPPPAPAPTADTLPVDHFVNIRGASCQDLLNLSPDDRSAASLFYIGYLSSRFHVAAVNVPTFADIEVTAQSYCADHPNRTAVQAYTVAYTSVR
jgi:hypothetical protein